MKQPLYRGYTLDLYSAAMKSIAMLSRLPGLLLLTAPLYAQVPVKYSLSFPHAIHHEAEIQATFNAIVTPVLEVVMSRSSPGRYALHEFAKNVYNVRATDASGHALRITRPNPYGWNVAVGVDKTVRFSYTLFGDHADGTYSGIDETHAHLNMPATLVWAHGYENTSSSVHFDLPRSDWTVATQMLPQKPGDFTAPNLEWLMDCPVEISNHLMPEWKVENAVFRLSLHHNGTAEEAARYVRLCQAVVLEEEGIFGGLPKYDGGTYTFLADYLPYVSGDGMEHRDSTSLTSTQSLNKASDRLIGAVSHEFFHSWNVRRIRPKSLEPFDFEHVNMSGELWFAEGFTNYYGVLTLQRAGISKMDAFTESMGGAIDRVLNAPGRLVHSAVEMSELAPFVDAATSIDANNFRNTFISYYTYGQALGLGIDMAIRARFPGKSLDDWMRAMWRRHPDIEKPYTLADLETTLAEATGDKAFAHDTFERHIRGKEAMDYSSLLAPAGMLLRHSPDGAAWWGSTELTMTESGAELKSETTEGTPLYEAGLERGDKILEIEGKKMKVDTDRSALLAGHKPGDIVKARVKTRGSEHDVKIRLAQNPRLEMVTFEGAGQQPTAQQLAFRKAWLESKAMHPLPDVQ